MANTKEIDLGVIGQVEHVIEGRLPSPLRPYAKALAAALPALITAYGTLQSGHIGVVTVIQFIISVLTVGGVYLAPLLQGKWESGAKTTVAIVGAVLSAGVAAFGAGGTEGWFSFGTAALAALLVEIVDNVPNAAPVVVAAEQVAQDVLNQARPPFPSAPTISAGGAVSAVYNPPVSKPVVPLPTADEVSPEG